MSQNLSSSARVRKVKHREEEKLENALEVILKASEEAVENLQNPILREEVQKTRSMIDE
jgi:hypothetical protein